LSPLPFSPLYMKPMTYICPECGGDVEVGIPSCPRCLRISQARRQEERRSFDQKPWEQEDIYDGTDLLEDDFDYDAFMAREFDHPEPPRKPMARFWVIIGWILIITLVGIATGWFFY
jgi:hypothetical protein